MHRIVVDGSHYDNCVSYVCGVDVIDTCDMCALCITTQVQVCGIGKQTRRDTDSTFRPFTSVMTALLPPSLPVPAVVGTARIGGTCLANSGVTCAPNFLKRYRRITNN